MKKKKWMIILCLLLLLVVGGVTYAAFVQTSTATGTSIVARWRFRANKNKEAFTIDLTKNAINLLNGKIGPGSSGSFEIELDGTGSQVDIDYSVKFANLENIPSNMNFFADSLKKNKINLESYEIKGVMTYGASMQKKYVIYWEWPTNGVNDTSYAGKTLTFDVLVEAVQKVS